MCVCSGWENGVSSIFVKSDGLSLFCFCRPHRDTPAPKCYRSVATRGDVAAMSEERDNQDGLLLDSLAHAQQKLQVLRRAHTFVFSCTPCASAVFVRPVKSISQGKCCIQAGWPYSYFESR